MSTPQSDTPRTDAETMDVELGTSGWMNFLEKTKYPDGSGEYVASDFARTLERELTAALARVVELERRTQLIGPPCPKCGRMEMNLGPEAEAEIRKLFEPPAPTYYDRPNAPGLWWCWVDWNGGKGYWIMDEIDEDVLDCVRVSKWTPATPPPPPTHRSSELAHARLKGVQDAREGVTIPPPDYCEETKQSKMLREAWLEGWHSVGNTTPPPPPAKEDAR